MSDTSSEYSYSDTIYFIESDSEADLNDLNEDLKELEIKDTPEGYTILSIDIGISHLGLAGLLFDSEYNFIKIIGVDMIDITEFHHPEGIKQSECHLYHTKTFTDWLEHVFWKYSNVFDGVDGILIERQPPQGLVAIEQLIFSRYRDKCELVSPNSMHKHFGIGHMTYERRKEATMNIASYHINDPIIMKEYSMFERKHDIADAICLGLYWLNSKHVKYAYDKKREEVRNMKMTFFGSSMTMKEWIEQFRYQPTYYKYIPL